MPLDAERLARWELAGSPRPVWVPDEDTEGLRDLCHAIENRRRDRTTAYLRIQGLLCQHDKIWNQRTKGDKLKITWTKDHFDWLDSIELPSPGAQEALRSAIDAARSAKERYDELVAKAQKVAAESGYAEVIDALCFLKCVQFVTALTLCAEVGDIGTDTDGLPAPSVTNSKNGVSRIVPAAESVVARRHDLAAVTGRESGLLFMSPLTGRPWAYDSVRRKYRRLFEDAGVRTWDGGLPRIHDLRNADP